jgi:hypothetical protein
MNAMLEFLADFLKSVERTAGYPSYVRALRMTPEVVSLEECPCNSPF